MGEVDSREIIGSILRTTYGLIRPFLGRAPEDGWRMSGRVHLRGEVAKFALAAFGLQIEAAGTPEASARALLERLASFLREQQTAHWALEWQRFAAVRYPKDLVDLTWARFDPGGRLLSIDPLLDGGEIVPYERFLRALLADLLCDAYNETRCVPDLERPLALEQYAFARIGTLVERVGLPHDAREAATSWVWRVLTSTVVAFERLDEAEDPRRFVIPQFLDTRHFGHGVFDIRVRMVGEVPAQADLWVHANHAAVDGVPVEEMLDALKAAWGQEKVQFPTRGEGPAPGDADETADTSHGTVIADALLPPAPAPPPASFERTGPPSRPIWANPMRCSPDTEHPYVYTAVEFVDLGGFQALRRELSSGATRMWLWALAHQPAFADRKFSVAVDVPPVPGEGPDSRTVCFVVMRPADHFPGAYEGAGFEAFNAAFQREAELTRQRSSAAWRLFEDAAPMPAAQQDLGARYLPKFGQETFGTVGISLIRHAEIFVAPYHPMFVDGFIAFADFAHAAEGGASRCAVTFKAGRRRLEACREAVLAIAATPRKWFPNVGSAGTGDAS